MSRLVRAVRHLADGICAALLCAIAALAFFQVVARYLLGLSTPWSEELLRLLFIWLVLMIVQGLDLVELTAYDRYTALPLSVQWSYWAVVAGCGLWLLFLALDTARSLRRRG